MQDTSPAGSSQPSSFHGWKILGLVTACQFFSVGFSSYLIGLYLEPMAQEFGASRSTMGWGSTIFYTGMALLGPLLGNWVDRGRIRTVFTLGAALLAVGLIAMSQVHGVLPAALICLLLLAPGAAMLGMVPAATLVVQWFRRRRGMALGVMAAGMSLGGFFVPPFAAYLISSLGWRPSLAVMGAIVGVVMLPLCWKLAVSKPAVLGQFPDGDAAPAAEAAGEQAPASVKFAELAGNRNFWGIALSMGLLSFCSVVLITYLIPYVGQEGIPLQTGALLLSCYAGAAFGGKFIAGWLCDRVNPANVLSGLALVAALGWVPLIHFPSLPSFIASVSLTGLAIGSLTPTIAALVACKFGPLAYGKVKGASALVSSVFLFLPGPVGGLLYDQFGSYQATFGWLWWAFPLALACSFLLSRASGAALPLPAPDSLT